LLLISDGPRFEQVKQKVSELGLQDAVFFAGRRNDVAGIYSAMDLFLFPSMWEGLGMVLVEAQAAGLPCVVSDAVTEEVNITDNVQFLPLTEDADNWCEAIVKALDKPNENREQWAGFVGNTNFNIKNEAVRLEGILNHK